MSRRMVAVLAAGVLLGSPALLWSQVPQRPARASVGIGVSQTPPGVEQAGVVIAEVMPNSAGEKAGLRPGDVVTRVGNQEVRTYDDLVNAVARHRPGDRLAFQVRRDGKEQTLTVTLGERRPPPSPEGALPPQAVPPGRSAVPPRGRQPAFLGVRTAPLTADARERLGVTANEGVLVTDVVPGTPADQAGLKVDDVITRVDGQAVPDPERLREAISRAGVGKEVDLKVARGNKTLDLKARLEEVPSDIGMVGPMGNFPPFGRGFPGAPGAPGMTGEARRVQQLERRVQDLERRVRELEEKQGRTPSK